MTIMCSAHKGAFLFAVEGEKVFPEYVFSKFASINKIQ